MNHRWHRLHGFFGYQTSGPDGLLDPRDTKPHKR
jgi:hypothetical protein